MTSADFYPQPGEGKKIKEKKNKKNKKRNRKRNNKNKNKGCDYSYNKCSKRKFFAGFVMLRLLPLLGPSSPSLCGCWESMLNNNDSRDSRDNSENSERAGIVSGSWENNQLFLLALSTNICATCAAGNRVCNICLPGQVGPRGTVATELQHIVAIAQVDSRP